MGRTPTFDVSTSMNGEHGGTCPYCGSDTKHLNNHIRMSAGEHSPQGQYPGDWDSSSRSKTETADAGGSETPATEAEKAAGGTQAAAEGSTDANPEGQTLKTITFEADDPADQSAAELQLADSPDDAREYECGECGTEVGYLQDTCPDGHGLTWQGVSA